VKNHINYKNITFIAICSLIYGSGQIKNEDLINPKVIITNTNDGSKVLLDKTIPTLEIVELTINNKNSNYASIGDELLIKATASEGIIQKKILINGQPVNDIDLSEREFYASYFFTSTDNNGIVKFEISFSDSSGNQGEIVKSTTDRSKIIFDKIPPSDFTTGTVTSKGGIIRQESWNSTNTHLVANVPINKSDTTLVNGKLQIWAKIRENQWEAISGQILIVSEDLGKDKSVSVKELIIESITGFKDGEHINIKSIIKDIAGNTTEGALSKNKIIIDQTPPIISKMTIESSNEYPSKARISDEITIRFQADEKIEEPTFTIYKKEIKAKNTEGFTWNLNHTLQDSDLEGEIKFSHTPFIDIHGNPSIPIRKSNKIETIDTTLFFENGNKFVGKWKFGNINGFGQYTWEGIGSYKGNWLDGKKHGNGTMIWIDGSKYEGGWALDEFDGYGTYYYNNGDVYKGEWKNGKKSGKGIFTWNSGNTYKGNWIDGKRTGDGIMAMSDGEKWAVKILSLPN
tara:strand:- start:1348 stop:2892 length:1545 start_codon:yes stop_codon:yes gene_type:complete